jgi:hypothetical protein
MAAEMASSSSSPMASGAGSAAGCGGVATATGSLFEGFQPPREFGDLRLQIGYCHSYHALPRLFYSGISPCFLGGRSSRLVCRYSKT